MPKPQRKATEFLAEQLVRYRWYLLLLGIAIGCGSFMVGNRVSFDTSIESMFAAQNPALVDYLQLKRTFGGSEIALAVYEDPQLFASDGSGLKTLERHVQQVSQVPGIAGVLSLSEINLALKKVFALGNLLAGDSHADPVLQSDNKLAKKFVDIFEGYTHGRDRKTVAIVCLLEPAEQGTTPRDETIAKLRRVTDRWPNGKITGEPVMVADGFRFVQRDGRRLNQVSLLLMSVVIIGCFRSIRWMLIPIAVIQLALWMTLALLVLFDWKLTMVSSMLSAIVAVISVATVVHFTVRFREMRSHHSHSRIRSVEIALASLLVPITWTCITTAAGFLALTIADVEPVRDFGWMMAIGSMMVLVSMIFLVPGLTLLGDFDSDPQRTWGDGRLTQALQYSSLVVTRYPRRIGICLLIVFSLVAWGTRYIHVETDFTKNFRRDSEIARAYAFVEQRLGGAGVLDVVIPSPETLDAKYISRVDQLQDELRQISLNPETGEPALTHVVSFADADRAIRSNAVLKLIPMDFRFEAMSQVMPGFASQMKTHHPDQHGQHYFRIMLRTSQQKSADEQQRLIAKVRDTVEEHFPQQPPAASLTTGLFVLLSNLVSSILDDQVRTFVVATIFIAVAILVAFGSPRLVLIALLPNILPILSLLGLLGWLGIPINMGVAMIAAVSIGLSIDGTIHYLNSYRHNRRFGHRVVSSIARVQQRIGRAVTYSTIALVAGFGSLCISEFIPTVYFGALVGLSMLGGLLGNLVILPVLLTLFDTDRPGHKKIRKPSRSQTPIAPAEPAVPLPPPHHTTGVDPSQAAHRKV